MTKASKQPVSKATAATAAPQRIKLATAKVINWEELEMVPDEAMISKVLGKSGADSWTTHGAFLLDRGAYDRVLPGTYMYSGVGQHYTFPQVATYHDDRVDTCMAGLKVIESTGRVYLISISHDAMDDSKSWHVSDINILGLAGHPANELGDLKWLSLYNGYAKTSDLATDVGVRNLEELQGWLNDVPVPQRLEKIFDAALVRLRTRWEKAATVNKKLDKALEQSLITQEMPEYEARREGWLSQSKLLDVPVEQRLLRIAFTLADRKAGFTLSAERCRELISEAIAKLPSGLHRDAVAEALSGDSACDRLRRMTKFDSSASRVQPLALPSDLREAADASLARDLQIELDKPNSPMDVDPPAKAVPVGKPVRSTLSFDGADDVDMENALTDKELALNGVEISSGEPPVEDQAPDPAPTAAATATGASAAGSSGQGAVARKLPGWPCSREPSEPQRVSKRVAEAATAAAAAAEKEAELTVKKEAEPSVKTEAEPDIKKEVDDGGKRGRGSVAGVARGPYKKKARTTDFIDLTNSAEETEKKLTAAKVEYERKIAKLMNDKTVAEMLLAEHKRELAAEKAKGAHLARDLVEARARIQIEVQAAVGQARAEAAGEVSKAFERGQNFATDLMTRMNQMRFGQL